MAPPTRSPADVAAGRGGAAELRAGADDLERIAVARAAAESAAAHLDATVLEVAARRRVTRDQIAGVLAVQRRTLYKRYPQLGLMGAPG